MSVTVTPRIDPAVAGRVRSAPVPVTLIAGDGIGPEIVAAVRRVLDAAGARVAWEAVDGGDVTSPELLDSIARTGVVLAGPMAPLAGRAAVSPAVALRRHFECYAGVRPARELPGVVTPFSGRGVDLVVVRETTDELHAGVEHLQTPGVAQALTLVAEDGCERIARFACELAEDEGRSRLTCASRADHLPLTEGMFRRVVERVASEHAEVSAQHLPVDEVALRLVRAPEQFDVLVTTALHGDLLAELATGLVGGPGVAPAAHVGDEVAIFEAVHGAAPDLAGQDVANPTALLLAAVMMLRHVGDLATAERVEQAVLVTLERGVHTVDLGAARVRVGTRGFADAVVGHLGECSATHPPGRDGRAAGARFAPAPRPVPRRPLQRERTVGMDVFIHSDWPPAQLGASLAGMTADTPLRLQAIANRGTQVFPAPAGAPALVDHYRCRFVAPEAAGVDDRVLLRLLERIGLAFRWVHVERLREFDGVAGFTTAPGAN